MEFLKMNKSVRDPRSMIPFGAVLASADFRVIVCDNPYHIHQSPIQEMTAVEYQGHHVAITRDGRSYSVRIDRQPLTDRHDLSMEEVIAYVESKTGKGGE